jgi:hypothetical protein
VEPLRPFRPWENLPSFPPPLRSRAGPLRILSMMRLCRLAEQTSPPQCHSIAAALRWNSGSRACRGRSRSHGAASTGGGVVCGTKRMPSRRSARETRERREMQAGRQIFILSRLTSFPACLAAGPACVLLRLCRLAEQTTPPCAVPSRLACPASPERSPGSLSRKSHARNSTSLGGHHGTD